MRRVGKSEVGAIAAFEDRFARAQATDVVELPWGYVLLQSEFPDSYHHNRVVVTAAAPVTDILRAADRVLGGAGVSHRHVSVADDELGRALGPGLVAAGFDHDALVLMINDGSEPGNTGDVAPTPPHLVRSVPLTTLRSALIRDWRVELPDVSDAVIDQLADRAALYSRGADVERLAAFDGAEIASRADLYFDAVNGIAQLESLVTHPAYRGRGFARAIVEDAQRRIKAASCRISFLQADLNDWPRSWYRRWGYVDARRQHEFTRATGAATQGTLGS